MEPGTLIMICGLPGAGKTTLAQKLEIERNALRLCPDEWILPLLKDTKDISELDRLREPVEQLLWKETQRLLQLGVTVIMENGFWPDWERAIYRDRAKELGAKVELHFLDAPFETLWERVSRRNEHPETEIVIRQDTLKEFTTKFNPPSEEEGKTYDFYKRYW